jgi:mycoredoxin
MVEEDINIDVRRDSSRMTDSVTSPVTMYTTPWCGYCHRLKGQMDREGIAYDIVDIEQHPEAAALVESVNSGNQTVPTLVYSDGSAQTNPSVIQVREKLAALAS